MPYIAWLMSASGLMFLMKFIIKNIQTTIIIKIIKIIQYYLSIYCFSINHYIVVVRINICFKYE